MVKEGSLELRLRTIDETRNSILGEIKIWFNEWKI